VKRCLFIGTLMVFAMTGAVARADTSCSMGGPVSGYRALRISLPHGASYADLRFTSSRPTYVAGDRSSWHLAQGVALIDARTRNIITFRVGSWGSSPRRVVIRQNGTDLVRQDVAGPDSPFVHASSTPVQGLLPGTYYAIGFGTDGDRRLPNPLWGAEIKLGADATCISVGTGGVFDYDQTQFAAGTQVSAWGPGFAQQITKSFTSRRQIVFGLMDIAVQGAGSDQLSYSLPGQRTGTLSNRIVPFVAGPGRFTFRASFTGLFPLALVSGVVLDLK
jgi:hypothetical protein